MYKDIILTFVHAPWCNQCRGLEPTIKEVILETGVQLKDVNADKEMDFCEKKGIMGLPVVLISRGDKEVRIDGLVAKQKIVDTINSLC